MKLRWMTSAALALGVASVIPSVAKADNWRNDRDHNDRYENVRRDDWRHDRYDDRRDDYRRVEREFDVDVPLREVPHAALDVANYERHGRRIEAVQYVFRDGQ